MKRTILSAAIGTIAVILPTILLFAIIRPQTAPVQPNPTQIQPMTIAPQVAESRKSVVHIAKHGVCQGSGCIISPDGIIFSAKHVSDNEPGEYTVTLDNGDTYPVKYVIEDTENDLSFMQLDLQDHEPNLPAAPLAGTNNLRPGDFVYIMGSPFGKGNFNTVSLGLLSDTNRNLADQVPGEAARFDWHVMMQTTSPAYPGKSGGPIFNLDGEVVGVLVAGLDATLNWGVPVARFSGTIETVRDWFALCRFDVVEEVPEPSIQLNIYNGYGYLHSGTAVR